MLISLNYILESFNPQTWNSDNLSGDDLELTSAIQKNINKPGRLYNLADETEKEFFNDWVSEMTDILKEDFNRIPRSPIHIDIMTSLNAKENKQYLWKQNRITNGRTYSEPDIAFLPSDYVNYWNGHFTDITGVWMMVGRGKRELFMYMSKFLLKHDYVLVNDIEDVFPCTSENFYKKFYVHKNNPNKLLMLSYYPPENNIYNPLALNFIAAYIEK